MICLFTSTPIIQGLLEKPASSGFTLWDTFGWKEGLEKKFSQAKSLYSVIVAYTLIGVWMTLSNVNPIQTLIGSALINEVCHSIYSFYSYEVANRKKIIENRINGPCQDIIVWLLLQS